jgi:uncharacterized protein
MRVCPNDGTQMRQFQKKNVVIDQCPNCGGIFLDAGELENLENAASGYYANAYGAPPPQPVHYSHHGHGGHGHGGHYGYGHRGHKRRREGFFGELFD